MDLILLKIYSSENMKIKNINPLKSKMFSISMTKQIFTKGSLVILLCFSFATAFAQKTVPTPKVSELNSDFFKSKQLKNASSDAEKYKYIGLAFDDATVEGFRFVYNKLQKGRLISKINSKKVYIEKNYEILFDSELNHESFARLQETSSFLIVNGVKLNKKEKGFIISVSDKPNEGLYFIDDASLKGSLKNQLTDIIAEDTADLGFNLYGNKFRLFVRQRESLLAAVNDENLSFEDVYVNYVNWKNSSSYWLGRFKDSMNIYKWMSEDDASVFMGSYIPMKTINSARELRNIRLKRPAVSNMNIQKLMSKEMPIIQDAHKSGKFKEVPWTNELDEILLDVWDKIEKGHPIKSVQKNELEVYASSQNLFTPPLDHKRFIKLQKNSDCFTLNFISHNSKRGLVMNKGCALASILYFIPLEDIKRFYMSDGLKNRSSDSTTIFKAIEKKYANSLMAARPEFRMDVDLESLHVAYKEWMEMVKYRVKRYNDSFIVISYVGEKIGNELMGDYIDGKGVKAKAKTIRDNRLKKEYNEDLRKLKRLQFSPVVFKERYGRKKWLFDVNSELESLKPILQPKIDSIASDYVKNNYGKQYLELVNHEKLNESRYYPGLKYNQNYVYFKSVPSPKETSPKIYSRDTLKGASLFGSMSFFASLKPSSGSNKTELNTDYWIKKRLDKSPRFYCIGGLTSFASYLGIGSNFNPTADSTILKFKERILPITTKSYHSIGQVLKSEFYGTKTEKAQFVFSENPYLRVKAERSNSKFASLCNDCVCDFDSAQLVTRVIEYKKTRDLFEQQAAEMKAKEEAEAKAAEQKQKNELYAKYGKKYVDAAYEGEIITGMHEDLVNVIVSKMYYVSSSTELGNGATKYWLRPNNSSATINLIITIKNKKVTRVSTWRR